MDKSEQKKPKRRFRPHDASVCWGCGSPDAAGQNTTILGVYNCRLCPGCRNDIFLSHTLELGSDPVVEAQSISARIEIAIRFGRETFGLIKEQREMRKRHFALAADWIKIQRRAYGCGPLKSGLEEEVRLNDDPGE